MRTKPIEDERRRRAIEPNDEEHAPSATTNAGRLRREDPLYLNPNSRSTSSHTRRTSGIRNRRQRIVPARLVPLRPARCRTRSTPELLRNFADPVPGAPSARSAPDQCASSTSPKTNTTPLEFFPSSASQSASAQAGLPPHRPATTLVALRRLSKSSLAVEGHFRLDSRARQRMLTFPPVTFSCLSSEARNSGSARARARRPLTLAPSLGYRFSNSDVLDPN